MAERLSKESAAEEAPPLNSTARKAIIRETCAQLKELDEKIAALNAKRRNIVNKRIKGDLGMKVADFAFARRLYALEGGDRDELFETLTETFKALGKGGQLD